MKAIVGAVGAIAAQFAFQIVRKRQLMRAETEARKNADEREAALMTTKARAVLAFIISEEQGKVRVLPRGRPRIEFGSDYYINAEVVGGLEEFLEWRKAITFLESIAGLLISPMSRADVSLYLAGDEAVTLSKRFPPPPGYEIPWEPFAPRTRVSLSELQRLQRLTDQD